MDDYKLKTEFTARLGTEVEVDLAGMLAESGRASIHGTLSGVTGNWTRATPACETSWPGWRPASHGGSSGCIVASVLRRIGSPWRSARMRKFSKRLIFSSWQVVPKAIASVLSYEVERRIFQRFDYSMRNTPEERRRSRPLLRFSFSNERPGGMPVLGILYPSPQPCRTGRSTDRGAGQHDAAKRCRLRPAKDRTTGCQTHGSTSSMPHVRTKAGTGQPRYCSTLNDTTTRPWSGLEGGIFPNAGTERRRWARRTRAGADHVRAGEGTCRHSAKVWHRARSR